MRNSPWVSGWRGVALIAVVYVYFLIFAQFAFLTRLSQLGIGAAALKIVMAAMAAGGILLSLLTPRTSAVQNGATSLRIGLTISALGAFLSLLPLGISTAALVAFLIGAGLGITTVTLVTHLRIWTGEGGGILRVGLGTGIAYFICNVPAVFTATPRAQAVLAGALCLIAIGTPLASAAGDAADDKLVPRMSFVVALASFAALIWLDSAAFFIIQHNAVLKAGTWLGSVHLWTNGTLHLITAVIASLLLLRGRTAATLALAFAALAFACLLLRNPSLILSASLFYPVGVSFYSVALVAYPSFLTDARSTADRARQAGWIYAIAGWIGSALGIGMGQNLGHIPFTFVVLAGVMVLTPTCLAIAKHRSRELALIALVGAVSFMLFRLIPERQSSATLTAAERGRQVYISEGCISCHSQYVRPNTADVLMWGPTRSLEELHSQKPPLIGNRRQGPDLSRVGMRRSPLWLKAHLINPAEVSYRSPMPSYAFLFSDTRGNDLIAYLSALNAPGTQQLQEEQAWIPAPAALTNANARDGQIVYEQHCATCHDTRGATRLRWIGAWRKVPQPLPELREYAAYHSPSNIAQIARFGIPGTDMPGHEYLSDQQIASVALWLKLASMQAASQPLPQ